MRLNHLLTMTPTGHDSFVAPTPESGWRRVFGGHLLGQALAAAQCTIDPMFVPHNMQTSFYRAARTGAPLHYDVERIHDGRRFGGRRVTASQDARVLTVSHVSFQQLEEGLNFTPPMPIVPPPETLPNEHCLRSKVFAEAQVEWCLSPLLPDLPVELRPVQERDFIAPPVLPPNLDFWLRLREDIEPRFAGAAVACISDIFLLSTTLLPHGLSWATTPVEGSTLNHSLWFHDVIPHTDWMLWSMEAQWTGRTRGLAMGRLWSANGRLLATAMQEGLVRLRVGRDAPEPPDKVANFNAESAKT